MEDGGWIIKNQKRITAIRDEHPSRMECNIVIISSPLVEIHHTCFVKLFDNTALMMMVITLEPLLDGSLASAGIGRSAGTEGC